MEINGRHVDATDRELADWIISFSAGATPQAVAELLRPRLIATPEKSVSPNVFLPEGVWALLRAAASAADGALYLTAAFTGLRMGELLALLWRDIDVADSAVRVRASYDAGDLTTPKSGKVRAVPLAPDVASALAQLGQRCDWVRVPGAAVTRGRVGGSSESVSRRAGARRRMLPSVLRRRS